MRAYLPEWLRERRNHRFKNESTVFAQELVLKYESWKVLREILPYEFFSSTPQSNREINFRNKFSIPLCPHMKIANVHVGTIDRNVRIALQFSYWFAIFISVCNFHISLQFSLFGVWFLRWRLQFSYGFAIFIWVCNFHISLQFSRPTAGLLTYTASYRFPCNDELELITPRQPQFSVEETKKN